MNYRKTRFRFQISENQERFSQVIMRYITIDGMKQFNIKQGVYYMNDVVTGGQNLEYAFINNELVIRAWIGGWNRPMPLSGKMNILLINAFRSKLTDLFTALQNEGAIFLGEDEVEDIALYTPNTSGVVKVVKLQDMNPHQGTIIQMQSSNNMNMNTDALDDFKQKENNRKELLTKIGLGIAILNALFLLTGNSILGGLGYIITISLGVQGLKTKCRKLAIATIAISAISGIIFLFLVIIGLLVSM